LKQLEPHGDTFTLNPCCIHWPQLASPYWSKQKLAPVLNPCCCLHLGYNITLTVYGNAILVYLKGNLSKWD
jgi:hypothetical protein